MDAAQDMERMLTIARTIVRMLLLTVTTFQDDADDTVDATQDTARMLTIARTIVWMLLLLEMACPTCPALPCNAAALLLPERKQWEF